MARRSINLPRPSTSITAGWPLTRQTAICGWAPAIGVRGTNFTTNTRVIFPTRDNNGQTGSVVVAPNIVSSDGTRLQVSVPDLATTGNVTLNTVPNSVNLGFSGRPDTIYRNIT